MTKHQESFWGPAWLKGSEPVESQKPAKAAPRKPATPPVAVPTRKPSAESPDASCGLPGASPADEPPGLPWRETVAGWPTAWRERWGLRANELEAAGLDWRSAERTAFDEMTTEDDD